MKKLRHSNIFARLLQCIFLASSAVFIAGASSSAEPVNTKVNFSGGWSVKWCDKKNPKLDCGGFNITLIQDGDRICGDFGGALVNLRQIDEGTIIGTLVGNTAVLAVESMRNQEIVLVRAEIHGNALNWKEVDNIKRGGNDISIIATDDVLKKDIQSISVSKKNRVSKKNCDSYKP
jgi:hypothetical protein